MTNPLRIVRSRTLAAHTLFCVKATALTFAMAISFSAPAVTAADGWAYAGERPFQPVPVSELSESEMSDSNLTKRDLPEASDQDNLPIAVSEPWPAAQLAIVIDDLGYDKRRGLQAIALPGRLTVAVMPHTPNARFLAEAAHEAGREIILHHPMQGSDFRKKSASPKGILTLDMGPEDIRFELRQALTSVPHCIGINNHTGSTLTQARNHMYWLMQQVASTDLYYLDSRTTTQTVAGEAAHAWGVPFVSRDVFLDHHNDRESIAKQFRYAVKLAKRRGHAVLIAHPRPLSLELLAQQLPLLDSQEIELVHASELIGVRGRLNPGTTAAGGQ